MDSNHDNRIDEYDEVWEKLKIWQDANTDCITDEGELKTLAELGITKISTHPFNMSFN
ncbi:MAG: hypothetical protein RLZZ210_774 [Pseudomonadota bacterium]|jgi:hypothetical protein